MPALVTLWKGNYSSGWACLVSCSTGEEALELLQLAARESPHLGALESIDRGEVENWARVWWRPPVPLGLRS